ncbi:YbgF trimerization domain-containing protein [Sphingosinicella sp.]|uniref:YbgF trimerization domain-containing protein n=1 Tax=Sphingosinicella sp. TaxID=1917971 RepID=UPI004037D4FC
MRHRILTLILISACAMPTLAQTRDSPDRRIDRLEQEMRAVQRRVFPDGRTQSVDPEIDPARPDPSGPGASGDAVGNLIERIDGLEVQLRALTAQVEEQGNRNRELEREIGRLRTELGGRIERLEQQTGAAAGPPERTGPPPTRPSPRETPPVTEPVQPPAETGAGDPAEEAYNAGFRLWEARRYGEAQTTLEAAATRHAGSRWVSWMRNLAGRAHLDDGRPATAARIFLANYQENPRGERAADSLYFLGQSLTRLDRRAEACRVYDELAQVYPNMREFIRTRLPQARTDARCTSPARPR